MGGFGTESQLGHQPGQAGGLAGGQVEHQARQRRGVEDRVLERRPQSPAKQPGVEGVMAVLDQDSPARKPQEGASGVPEAGCPDQHRPVDQMAAPGVWVDRSAAVDEGVEERQRTGELEALGSDLEDEERPVAGGLDVEGDELGLVEGRLRTGRGGGRLRLAPGHRLGRAPRLEQNRLAR